MEMVAVMGLIMICIGIIVTTGQLTINKNICMNAAFEGARAAVVIDNTHDAKIQAEACAAEILKNGVALVVPEFTFEAGAWEKGNMLTFTVSGKVKVLFPIPDSSYKLNSLIPVKGTIVMMIERNP